MRRALISTAAIALMTIAGGCGVELVGGAEVETVMTDDPENGAEPSPTRVRLMRSPSLGSQLAIAASGTLEADVAASLIRANGAPVALTPNPATGAVRIAAGDTSRLGDVEVLVDLYPTVRVTFSRVEAELDEALVLPGGLILEGTIRVDLSGDPLIVDFPLEVRVREDEKVTLVLDFNTDVWLALANPATSLVSRAAFEAAVEARIH